MSSNSQCFSVAVNLEIGVDSLERYPQNLTIPLKISHLISNKRVQTKSRLLKWSSSYGRFSTGMHNVHTPVKLEAAKKHP